MSDNLVPTGARSSKERLHPRAARIKLAAAEDYLAHLEFARRARSRTGEGAGFLDLEINAARNEVAVLAEWADARIEPRKRTPAKVFSEVNPRPEYWVFLDECGHHHLRVKDDPFAVFCLCAVVIADRDLAAFDALWKGWKTRWLGNPLVKVHEPDVRHRRYHFYRPDPSDQDELIRSLDDQLAELPFTCIAAAIDKQRFKRLYPTGTVDDFLPTSCYLICVDFVMERLVHFLSRAAGDVRGNVVAESRGAREDQGGSPGVPATSP